MEQTSHTPALTAADLTALRHEVQHGLITQARLLLKSLQLMEAPKTPQEVGRHANALLSISRAFDRLLPKIINDEDDDDQPALTDATDTAPVFKNRQQRRKAEAKARKAASAINRGGQASSMNGATAPS